MTNPCCERCAERLGGSGGGFLPNCANFACECHKSANCPECHFEPENGHALTCSKYVPRVYKSAENNYFETLKEPALKFDAPTDTSEEWKAGHVAALSKVKEFAEYEMLLDHNNSDYMKGYNAALADLLDHLKTIE